MQRRTAWLLAAAIGIVFGWVIAGGVALWTDDTSTSGNGTTTSGSSGAEWVLGIGVAVVVTAMVGFGLQQAAARKLLGAPQRPAGGVGMESATANPDPEPDGQREHHEELFDRSKRTP